MAKEEELSRVSEQLESIKIEDEPGTGDEGKVRLRYEV